MTEQNKDPFADMREDEDAPDAMDSEELDWDDEIENDGSGGYTLLPDGSEATWFCKDLEKTYSQSNNKMAKLILKVSNEHGETEIHDHLVLLRKCEWKLTQFFNSAGLRKRGEKIKMPWNQVKGSTGRCIVGVREFEKRDGGTGESNEIKKYLEPDEDAPAGENAETSVDATFDV